MGWTFQNALLPRAEMGIPNDTPKRTKSEEGKGRSSLLRMLVSSPPATLRRVTDPFDSGAGNDRQDLNHTQILSILAVEAQSVKTISYQLVS